MVYELSQCSNNTKVFIRILPMLKMNWDYIKILDDQKTFYVRCLQDFGKGRENFKPNYWKFCTDGIFYNCTQTDVYNTIDADFILESVLQGNNAVILSYGQTCSGKTVTTSGLENCYEDRGLIPRILAKLYDVKRNSKDKFKICVQIAYVETTRSHLMDLLTEEDDIYDMTGIKHIKTITTKTFDAAMKIIFKAEAKKTIRNITHYNSNIANSVLTLTLTTKGIGPTITSLGKLHIVDLCGADTLGNISCLHKNGFEVGHGNLAKTQLEQFILVLNAQSSIQTQFKQRLCIIVNYLKDSLNSHTILRFIGHIRNPPSDMKVTISMLRFAQLLRGIVSEKLKQQIYRDHLTRQQLLEDELIVLRKERDLNSMLMNEDLRNNLSQARFNYIKKITENYLQDKCGEIVVLTTTDAIMAMQVLKNKFDKIQEERNALAEILIAQNEEMEISKTKETIPTKTNKRSSSKSPGNASTISLTKSSKRGSHKKIKRDSKKDTDSKEGSIISWKTTTQGAKTIRSKKNYKRSADLVTRSDLALSNAIKIPEMIPSHEEAWASFIEECNEDYSTLNKELDLQTELLLELHAHYNEEIKKLNEIADLVTIRKDEVYKMCLLKDLEEDKHSLESLESLCNENLKTAEAQLVDQKEVLLKLQSEMKLSLESINSLKFEIERTFEEFCRKKYHLPIPNLEISDLDSKMIVQNSSLNSNENDDISKMESEEIEFNKNFAKFNEWRIFMNKEREKRMRNKIRNQKWIQSCKFIM